MLSVMRGEGKYTREQYEAARDAAPYTTPRLVATTVTRRDAFSELTVGELRALIAATDEPKPAGAE